MHSMYTSKKEFTIVDIQMNLNLTFFIMVEKKTEDWLHEKSFLQ